MTTLGLWSEEKSAQKLTTSNGINSRERTSNNLATLTIKSLINSIMRSTSPLQLQTHPSSSNNLQLQHQFQHQLQLQLQLQQYKCRCNSFSQTCPCYSPQQICNCNSHPPCSPDLCSYHYQPVPHLSSLDPSSLSRRREAHKRFLRTFSRPFQRTRSQLSLNQKESRRNDLLFLRSYHQRDYSNWRRKWIEQQEELFNQKWIRGFETLLNVWPSHLVEVDNQGRYFSGGKGYKLLFRPRNVILTFLSSHFAKCNNQGRHFDERKVKKPFLSFEYKLQYICTLVLGLSNRFFSKSCY